MSSFLAVVVCSREWSAKRTVAVCVSSLLAVVVCSREWSAKRTVAVCVQFVPEECTEIAEVGDEVDVHYTVNAADVHETCLT